MSKYYFETQEFGISNIGIHFLRSRFNYKTIDYSEIDVLTVERGKEINNWLIILIIGVSLIAFSIYYSIRLYNLINNNEVRVIYIESILIPVIPFMLGGYCLFSATRNATILTIKTIKGKKSKFSLKEIEKNNQFSTLLEFLKEKTNLKMNV